MPRRRRKIVVDTRVGVIILIVAKVCGVNPSGLTERTFTGEICWARHLAMFFSMKYVVKSSNYVGSCFGVNHTTVLYARKVVADMINTIEYDQEKQQQYRRCEDLIRIDPAFVFRRLARPETTIG